MSGQSLLTPDWIDAMLDSGIPAEQVLTAVRGLLVRQQERLADLEEERAERKREGNRVRQSRYYDRHLRREDPEGEAGGDEPNDTNAPNGVRQREEREAPKSSPTPPKTTPREDNPSDPKGSSAPQGADRQRGTRIPDLFENSPEAKAVCAELGIEGDEADEALAEFRDYWVGVPGTKGRKLDWPATLRNRLREVGRRRRPTARASPGKGRRSGMAAIAFEDYGPIQ